MQLFDNSIASFSQEIKKHKEKWNSKWRALLKKMQLLTYGKYFRFKASYTQHLFHAFALIERDKKKIMCTVGKQPTFLPPQFTSLFFAFSLHSCPLKTDSKYNKTVLKGKIKKNMPQYA